MKTKIGTFQNNLNERLRSHMFEKLFSLSSIEESAFFNDSFTFPNTTDYRDWIMERNKLRDYTNIIGKSDKCLYNQIRTREGIPISHNTNLQSRANGIYIIGDDTGEILYIGKSGANFRNTCHDLVINRIIDHLVPTSINKMQNTPQIWQFIEEGMKIKICYWSGLNRLVPSLLELYLFNEYYLVHGVLPPLNKRNKQQKSFL